jgi:glycosyltransferase involved in cell wall biosynthesis
MRVCLVTLDFAPFRSSGLTVYAEAVACGLVERGHEVTVVAAARPERAVVDGAAPPRGIEIIRLPVGRADWLGLGWQSGRFLAAHARSFDVVHFADVHFAYAYSGRYVASAFQSFRQRLTSDQGRPYHKSLLDLLWRIVYYNVSRRLLEQPSVDRAAHILMPSQATQAEFLRHYRLAPGRTSLVYPGIDLAPYAAPRSRALARQLLGLPSETPVLLYVGFSTPRKGVEYLAAAIRSMRRDVCLVMVGEWERGYQERFLAVLGDIRTRVRLVGYVSKLDLLDYYSAADVFVLPTLLEGFGIPLVEAMALGIPLVTTSAGSAGEVAGDAGLVVPPGNSTALAAAIERVLAEPGLAQQLGQIGRVRAYACFDIRRMAVDVEAVYQRLLAK